MKRTYSRSSSIRVPVEELFAWHARPGAFQRLNPPWQPVKLLSHSAPANPITDGTRVVLQVPVGPLPIRWELEHKNCRPASTEGPAQFQDVQVTGPFVSWEHTHRFSPDGDSSSIIEDSIAYELPGGSIGDALAGWYARSQLERLFSYRHRVTANDLRLHALYSQHKKLKVLVSGARGFVGSQLVPFLTTGGHSVSTLVRHPTGEASTLLWNPLRDFSLPTGAEFDAVVHLAGENVAALRWSEEKKWRIRESRIKGTENLCRALARADKKPKVLVCASAIGYYGDRGDQFLDEHSSPGQGFLADVCREWEDACAPARDAGIRVVNVRIGVVLSPAGGALQKMYLPFSLGLGGVIGGGSQWVSWIVLDELLGVILHCLSSESVTGAVNAVSPTPVTLREFTYTLGQVLGRPTPFPVPAKVIKLALGEMADETLLASMRVRPAMLEKSGYRFRFPQLGPALAHVCGRE